jgi:hypothetical protein
MDPERRFSNENLNLLEVTQHILLKHSDIPAAASGTEVEGGDDDHVIQVQSSFTLPNSP